MVAATTSRHTSAIRYQPALDGIRGVAVAAVLAFHADHLVGGYLGVDAFFVLSGYLITSLLLHELGSTGTVAVLAFWGRRLRRLLPALVLVLLAVAAYAAFVAPAQDVGTIRADALSTLFYVANWRQVLTGSDYFALFSSPSPLQHTWSLAIEEQFYLVWPLLLLALNRRRPGPDAARRTLVLALTLIAASLAISVALANPADNTRTYYGTDTRVASILIGAALAAWCTRPRWTSRRARTALEVAAVGSIVFLGVAWSRLDGSSPVLARGGLLVCAVATAIVIASAAHPSPGPVATVLSVKPLRALGIISYGVYLWHWPIYVLLDADRTGYDGWTLFALRLAVTLAVATASYVLVERPIRFAPARSYRTLARLAPAAVVVVVVAVFLSTTTPAVPEAHAAVPADEAVRVLVAGDSVAYTLARDQLRYATSLGVPFGYAGRLGCGISPGDRRVGARLLHPPNCGDWQDRYRAGVSRARPDVSVLHSGVWELLDLRIDGREVPFGSPAFYLRLNRQLDRARRVLTADGARMALLTASCYRPNLKTTGMNPILADGRRVDQLNAAYRAYAAGHPQVALIDLHGFLCPGGEYRETVHGVEIRFDGVHFTPEGARVVWRWLAPRVRALAASSTADDPTVDGATVDSR